MDCLKYDPFYVTLLSLCQVSVPFGALFCAQFCLIMQSFWSPRLPNVSTHLLSQTTLYHREKLCVDFTLSITGLEINCGPGRIFQSQLYRKRAAACWDVRAVYHTRTERERKRARVRESHHLFIYLNDQIVYNVWCDHLIFHLCNDLIFTLYNHLHASLAGHTTRSNTFNIFRVLIHGIYLNIFYEYLPMWYW